MTEERERERERGIERSNYKTIRELNKPNIFLFYKNTKLLSFRGAALENKPGGAHRAPTPFLLGGLLLHVGLLIPIIRGRVFPLGTGCRSIRQCQKGLGIVLQRLHRRPRWRLVCPRPQNHIWHVQQGMDSWPGPIDRSKRKHKSNRSCGMRSLTGLILTQEYCRFIRTYHTHRCTPDVIPRRLRFPLGGSSLGLPPRCLPTLL